MKKTFANIKKLMSMEADMVKMLDVMDITTELTPSYDTYDRGYGCAILAWDWIINNATDADFTARFEQEKARLECVTAKYNEWLDSNWYGG